MMRRVTEAGLAPPPMSVVGVPKPATDLHALRLRAQSLYLAARGRASIGLAGDDWQVLDGRYQQLQQALNASRAAISAVNPNSAVDQAARASEERALLEAVECFESYQPPKAPKPVAMLGQVSAYHSAGSGEHWLETRERLQREQVARGEAA